MTYAAIDVGTNSIKLLVGRVEGQQVFPVLHRQQITRLGEGLHQTGHLSEAAAARTIPVLREFRELAQARGAERIAVAGTLALRSAKNGSDFVERCAAEASVSIRILSGEEEARLSFQGAAWEAKSSPVVAIDIGGGSTEIMIGSPTELHASWSLPIGAVTLTEQFLRSDPPGAAEMIALSASISRHLSKVVARVGKSGDLVGVGGTVASVLRLLRKNLADDTRGWPEHRIPFDSVSALGIHLSLKTVSDRERLGLEKGRSDIIVAGAWILTAAMSHLEATHLRASAHGLRHGLLLELASGRWQELP